MNIKGKKYFNKKHEILQNDIDIYIENLQQIYEKIKLFHQTIIELKNSFLNSNLIYPFDNLNEIFINFGKQLNILTVPIKTSVLDTLNNMKNNISQKAQIRDQIYNKLEELKDKKIEYKKLDNNKDKKLINYFKSNNPEETEKILNCVNKALEENNYQIYKYEKDSLREIRDGKLSEYDKINSEIKNVINNSSEINLIMNVFSNFIKQFIESLTYICSGIKEEIKCNITINESNKGGNNNKGNMNMLEEIQTNDFIVLDNDRTTSIKENISNIILEIINRETKLKSKEVIDIFNILEININNKKTSNATEQFLLKISEMSLNSVILVKNEDNFFHLANILNTIFLQNIIDLNISKQIISISRHIKFENIYLYEIIRKKNIYLRTKTLWIKLIEQDLINKLNKYIENTLKNRQEEKIKDEKSKSKKINSDLIVKKLEIEKSLISDFKKLNSHQLKEFNKYTQECSSAIISKYIPIIYQSLIKDNDKIIHDLFKNYRNILELKNNIVLHFENLLRIQKLNSKYKNQYNEEIYNYKYKKNISISLALKYLPQEDYPNILILNKKLYQDLKKEIFINVFNKENLSLDLHIKHLGQYLQIYKIKKDYNYDDLKKLNNSSLEEKNSNKNNNKIKSSILQDLNRTFFLQKYPNYKESFESILLTFSLKFNNIGYFQGFNNLVSFLFQLLNFDEEKTFYFLCGLQLNTVYSLIFKNKFAFLKILFSVFEKIIKLKIPEINEILKNVNVDLDYFCSSWFTTLFTGNFNIIDRNEPPLLFIYFLEQFCINSWSAIFNLGLTVFELGYKKIITLEKEELIKYFMNIINEENLFDNKNFEKCKLIYEKYSKYINKYLVDKLIEIVQFEYENKYLISD